MNKKSRPEQNWKKPGYHRSDVKVGGQTHIKPDFSGQMLTDKSTTWNKVSEITFEELRGKGVLTELQINTCLARFKKQGVTVKQNIKKVSLKRKAPLEIKNNQLVEELAGLDLSIASELQALKEIISREPAAAALLNQALKLRQRRKKDSE